MRFDCKQKSYLPINGIRLAEISSMDFYFWLTELFGQQYLGWERGGFNDDELARIQLSISFTFALFNSLLIIVFIIDFAESLTAMVSSCWSKLQIIYQSGQNRRPVSIEWAKMNNF